MRHDCRKLVLVVMFVVEGCQSSCLSWDCARCHVCRGLVRGVMFPWTGARRYVCGELVPGVMFVMD